MDFLARMRLLIPPSSCLRFTSRLSAVFSIPPVFLPSNVRPLASISLSKTHRCSYCRTSALTRRSVEIRKYSDVARAEKDSSCSEFLVQQLVHRRVLRVSGPDGPGFLQGLVTNDVSQLDDVEEGAGTGATAIYAMMLNVKGRVLYDLILYRLRTDPQSVLVECNADVSATLLKLLAKYKLRKKLTLSEADNEIKVWAAFGKHFSPASHCLTRISANGAMACVPDPRLNSFAYRLLLPLGVDGSSVVSGGQTVTEGYDLRRYQVGLSEGTTDLPPEQCLPLESNLVFLHGVNFDKGCYVGQELTARTQYTGVIRKRLMPLVLSSDVTIPSGATVVTAAGKPCGKVRAVVGRHGLALLRVEDVVGKGPLAVLEGEASPPARGAGEAGGKEGRKIVEAETFIPHWWQTRSDEVVKKTIAKGPDAEFDAD